jgi:transcription antitermination factor NusG
MYWLALHVTTGKEYAIRGKIARLEPNAQIVVPRRYMKAVVLGKVKTKSERMLPGYLLVGTEKPLNIMSLKEFAKVVGKVSEQEIDLLKASEGVKEDILDVGAKVIVIDGPFQGCKGSIIKDNQDGTMYCKMMFQGNEIPVNLKNELISTINQIPV